MKYLTLTLLLVLTTALPAHSAPFGGPPQQAFTACSGKDQGDRCSFSAPHGTVSGQCQSPRGNQLLCVPARGAPRSPMGTSDQRQRPDRAAGDMPGGQRTQSMMRQHNPDAIQVGGSVPDTGQGSCFNLRGEISCPKAGEPLFGQDAHYTGAAPAYKEHGDGTITDLVTGLMWQQQHNTERLGYRDAARTCANLRLGGYHDWRLPDIKELFSIADFSGGVGIRPYLNKRFEIREPDASILRGDRFAATHRTEMMGQTWSSTLYSGDHWGRSGTEAAFFFNFLDGRIKQAPTGGRNRLFYRCVRGEKWGENAFQDNRNGTISDRATGLVWQQADDGIKRDWQASLAYCEQLTLAGKSDWRLPNIKELQSIVDYSRHDPSLNLSYFDQQDRKGWFWSSTTHGDNNSHAAYICFGKCTSVEGVDVHGAGAQRSDPKAGNAERFGPMGGQRDAVRINNYARCVRSE